MNLVLAIALVVASITSGAPHTLRLTGLASTGVMVQEVPTPTPTPEPVVEPTPEPIVVAQSFSCGYGEPVEWFVMWPASERCYAVSQAYCESTLRPWAENGPYRGLFQIEKLWYDVYGFDYWATWMDPVVNSTVASLVVNDYGWRFWECR